jgi:hypothetical protein
MMTGKPGTELAKLIPKWAATQTSACTCSNMQKKMDARGVNWCDGNRDTIVKHLMSQSEHLIPILQKVPEKFKRKIASRLVAKAIENARKTT